MPILQVVPPARCPGGADNPPSRTLAGRSRPSPPESTPCRGLCRRSDSPLGIEAVQVVPLPGLQSDRACAHPLLQLVEGMDLEKTVALLGLYGCCRHQFADGVVIPLPDIECAIGPYPHAYGEVEARLVSYPICGSPRLPRPPGC